MRVNAHLTYYKVARTINRTFEWCDQSSPKWQVLLMLPIPPTITNHQPQVSLTSWTHRSITYSMKPFTNSIGPCHTKRINQPISSLLIHRWHRQSRRRRRRRRPTSRRPTMEHSRFHCSRPSCCWPSPATHWSSWHSCRTVGCAPSPMFSCWIWPCRTSCWASCACRSRWSDSYCGISCLAVRCASCCRICKVIAMVWTKLFGLYKIYKYI